MKTALIIQTILIVSVPYFLYGQINFTPGPGNTTHCPGEVMRYTANGSTCGEFTWTITNGKIIDPETNNEVTTIIDPFADVRWDNIAGTGTLKVSSTCSGEVKYEEKDYAISSLTGRYPANARASFTLPYCSTAGNTLIVDEMTLFNTGGTTGIQLEYADGYEWDLPPGWTSGGSDDGATVRTSAPIINIEPANGCSAGTATVRAYVNCSGRKYSSKANISLSRPQPNISISLPSGYSGPGCGDTQSRTFTVTPVSCAATYTWIFPSGWQHSTFTTVNNYITVTPSYKQLLA